MNRTLHGPSTRLVAFHQTFAVQWDSLYAAKDRGGKGVHPLWQGEMRGRDPSWDFLDLAPPSSNFWSMTPQRLKFFFRAAKIVQILMKIAQIQVLLSIFGYISLFSEPLQHNFS